MEAPGELSCSLLLTHHVSGALATVDSLKRTMFVVRGCHVRGADDRSRSVDRIRQPNLSPPLQPLLVALQSSDGSLPRGAGGRALVEESARDSADQRLTLWKGSILLASRLATRKCGSACWRMPVPVSAPRPEVTD